MKLLHSNNAKEILFLKQQIAYLDLERYIETQISCSVTFGNFCTNTVLIPASDASYTRDTCNLGLKSTRRNDEVNSYFLEEKTV